MHQHATLEDTVYFWFASNDTGGSGDDGAAPLYDVRLGGAAAGAAPVLSGNGTLLTHANYPAGCHEVEIAATAANGFAAGNTYNVFCTLAVDGENPTGSVGSFTLGPIPSRLTAAGIQDVAQFMYRTTDAVSVLEAGVDNAKTAIEAAAAGDLVILGPGTFALGDNVIDVPNGVSVLGAGIDATWITSTAQIVEAAKGAIVKPGTHSLIADFTIHGTKTDGTYQAALGTREGVAGQATFTNAVIRRCRLIADADGAYISHGSGSSMTLFDCIIETRYDAVTSLASVDSQITLHNCTVISEGPTTTGVATTRGLQSGGGGAIYAHNCSIRATEGGTNTRAVEAGATGIIEVHGGRLYSYDATGTVYDARNAGTRVLLNGVEYDRSKTNGTIIEMSGLDAPLGATPAGGSLMQRIQAIDLLTEGGGAGDLAAALAALALILADTDMLQTDWVNGGRLDNLLDAVVPGAAIELQTEGENLITP